MHGVNNISHRSVGKSEKREIRKIRDFSVERRNNDSIGSICAALTAQAARSVLEALKKQLVRDLFISKLHLLNEQCIWMWHLEGKSIPAQQTNHVCSPKYKLWEYSLKNSAMSTSSKNTNDGNQELQKTELEDRIITGM